MPQQPDAAVVGLAGTVRHLGYLYATMSSRRSAHDAPTPQWLATFVQRPESNSVHHGRGIPTTILDLPLLDLIFGTFRNPKEFRRESGFEGRLFGDRSWTCSPA